MPSVLLLTLVDGEGAEAARVAEGWHGEGTHRMTLTSTGLAEGLYQCRLVAGEQAVSRPLAVLPGLL